MKKLESSTDKDLCFEISCFFAIVCLDPVFTRLISAQIYDSLIVGLLSSNYETMIKAMEIITKSRLMFEPDEIVPHILTRVTTESNNFKTKVCRLLTRLYHGVPMDKCKEALQFVFNCVYGEEEVLIAEGAAVLCVLTDHIEEQTEEILQKAPTLPQRLAELLLTPNEDILLPVLRTVGNIITGSDEQTQMMIDAGIVPNLLWLLDYPNKKVNKEVCWTISNISAGSEDQIQAIIDAALVPRLLRLLKTSKPGDEINLDAVWAISNLLSGGSDIQKEYVINEGLINSLCAAWRTVDPTISNPPLLQPLYECILSLKTFAENGDSIRREKIRYSIKSNKDISNKLEYMKKHFLFDGQIASFLRFIQDGSFDALPTATHLHVLQQQQTPATTSSLPKLLNEEDRL